MAFPSTRSDSALGTQLRCVAAHTWLHGLHGNAVADSLPAKISGHYSPIFPGSRALGSTYIYVEFSKIKLDGENLMGIVSEYSSPSGRCISDNTILVGTYKDGQLDLWSNPLKSQYEGRRCGAIEVHVKVNGGYASGTLKEGRGDPVPIELELNTR